jgi:hypothetical protein
LLSTAILTALWSISASLISSPSYGALVGIAQLFAAIHFAVAVWFLRRIRSALKWFLLLLTVPVAVCTVQNLSRLLPILEAPGF